MKDQKQQTATMEIKQEKKRCKKERNPCTELGKLNHEKEHSRLGGGGTQKG